MKIRWTTPALRSLASIGDYIGRESPRAADRILARIENAVRGLRDQPEMGRAIGGDQRELVISRTGYIAVYRIRAREIVVLAIFHGRQERGDLNPPTAD